jgi:hypothetical protein
LALLMSDDLHPTAIVARAEPAAPVPEVAAMPDHPPYPAMNACFFCLLRAIDCLKEARRVVHRTVAGLRTSWFDWRVWDADLHAAEMIGC